MAIDTTQAVRIKTVVTQDGVLNLTGPFRAGESVEVIVLRAESRPVEEGERYPLRGTPYSYVDPFDSVAEDEWTAAQ
jgi:hypothetical protein